MTIAVPMAAGKLTLHFGHCEKFALVSVNKDSQTIAHKEELVPPPHEPGVLPKWLAEKGAQVIIAGGMGSRAQTLFSQNGITVVTGAPVETPEVLALSYLNGTLQTGSNTCDH